MNLEAMEKEAKLFDRDRECYLHVQRADEGMFTVLMSGDPAVIMQGIYDSLCLFEDKYHMKYADIIKMLKGARKACGKHDKYIAEEVES